MGSVLGTGSGTVEATGWGFAQRLARAAGEGRTMAPLGTLGAAISARTTGASLATGRGHGSTVVGPGGGAGARAAEVVGACVGPG